MTAYASGRGERLSLIRAAFVVARRDFTAILFSRAFFFFLLGPLFPVVVGALAGGATQRVDRTVQAPQIGLAMTAPDVAAMLSARERLAGELGPMVPEMIVLRRLTPGADYDPAAVLARREGSLAAVLTGTRAQPELTGTPEAIARWRGIVALLAAQAAPEAQPLPRVTTRAVAASGASDRSARMRTAQAGQLVLFMLIVLLAGMVLSNLVEEKANKVIEVLAAAIPMDAVFLGKLFAMLAVSLVGIAVWTATIGAFIAASGAGGLFGGGIDWSNLPRPGVGWTGFIGLAIAYFALGYLLLGSVFLAIGSLATTVREVQTLSMPVTMLQVFLFLFASMAVAGPGGWIEWTAMAFPFSSPFTMLAKAAMDDAWWPHALALVWQVAWVAVSIRFGAALFRKRVMKSGRRGPAGRSAGCWAWLRLRGHEPRYSAWVKHRWHKDLP